MSIHYERIEDRSDTRGGRMTVYQQWDNGYDWESDSSRTWHPFLTCWWYVRGLASNFIGAVERDFTPERKRLGDLKDEFQAREREAFYHGELSELPPPDPAWADMEVTPEEWRRVMRSSAETIRRRYPQSWRKAVECFAAREELLGVFPLAPLPYSYVANIAEEPGGVTFCPSCRGRSATFESGMKGCRTCKNAGIIAVETRGPRG